MSTAKVVPFRCMGGVMMISLRVGVYQNGTRLALELLEDGTPFAKMTVNIPNYPLKSNETFIDETMITNDVLTFICEQGLGEVRSVPGINYKVVAFDMNRLAEFDSDGVTDLSNIRA